MGERMPLDPQVRASLTEEFRSEIESHAVLVDRDLTPWLAVVTNEVVQP